MASHTHGLHMTGRLQCAGMLACVLCMQSATFVFHHNNFTIIEMVTLLLMVVLGGIGNIWGGVIGAILVTVIYDQTKDYYFYQPLIFGIIMVVMVVFMPHGIGGVVKQSMIKRKFIENQEESRGSA